MTTSLATHRLWDGYITESLRVLKIFPIPQILQKTRMKNNLFLCETYFAKFSQSPILRSVDARLAKLSNSKWSKVEKINIETQSIYLFRYKSYKNSLM